MFVIVFTFAIQSALLWENPESQTRIEFSEEQIRTACIANDGDLDKRSLKNFLRRTACIANMKTLTCLIEYCFDR